MPANPPPPVIATRDVVLTDVDTGAQLMTVAATVVSVERKSELGIFGRVDGLEAHLQILYPDNDKPHAIFLSRLLTESCWLRDAHVGPNGALHYSHGFGARYLDKQGIHPALEALLDEAARRLDLATEIGPTIPLALTEHAHTGGNVS